MAKASFGKKIKFFIDAGPFLSILIAASENDQVDQIGNLYKRGDLKPFDSGIQAGIGMTIPIKKQCEFTFEDRNSTGFIKISNYMINSKTFSSSFFLLGFNYKFGKSKDAG